MHPALRHQLSALDRALLALVNERARLLQGVAADDPGRAPALDDLQRRHVGPFRAECLAPLFRAVECGCRPDGAAREP